MALAGSLGLSVRLNTLRLTGRRLPPQLTCGHLRNARSFSLVLQHSAPSRNCRHLFFSLPTRSYTKPSAESSVATSSTAANETAPLDVASSTAGAELGHAAPPVELLADAPGSDLSPDFVDTIITNLPPALQFGDLAALGLAGWTPAGLVRWSLEVINVATGLPWFWTIVVGSIFWKAVLVPLSIKGLRNSARILPLQPQIVAHQEELNKIRMSGDRLALQRQALKMRKMYKDAGVNMGVTALIPFVQIPVTLGMFFGVKKMCDLPVMQLTQSGLEMLPDLTVPDPYMILPILLCAAVNMQIQIGAAELNLKEKPEIGHLMNGLRLFSLVGVWVMSSFPSGLVVSLLTTSLATTVQSYALQQLSIRKALDIPIVPAKYRGKLPSPVATLKYLRDTWRSKVDAAAIARQQKNRKQ